MRSLVRVRGVVQGVGFRPFVHALAVRYGLAGLVGNDPGGVFIEAEGPVAAVSALVEDVRHRAPALAVVERVEVTPIAPTGTAGFHIVPSLPYGGGRTLVPPDAATCDACLAELNDPADRRYRYPFVNCTGCGPRYTIVTALPYDRPATTMAGFPLCPACRAEYEDPADRRFHAQPVCCPACGPVLSLVTPGGAAIPGDPVGAAAALLAAGGIVAIKGLGGYHLAADATDERAVATLRARKHRPHKPFALMLPDLTAVSLLCHLDLPAPLTSGDHRSGDGFRDSVAGVLTGPRRPIVLLPRRPGGGVAPSVAPSDDVLGVMLPYTPLHHLLTGEVGRPLVLTSGNVADEPIAHRDGDALARLGAVADAFLTHDRPIHVPADDSVVRVFRGTQVPVRRARGHAPEPITLPRPLPRPVLACGAELKSTFCLATDRHAFLSPHIGDLENYETLRAFTGGIEHFRRLFGIDPAVVAHDLHPEYLSTKYALGLPGVETVAVQHHHAHIASCLADNGETGPVVGIALDGTGYGPDGTIWGGELLVADLAGFRRAGHLEPVRMPGGVTAIRQPWRMAAAYLHTAYGPAADNDDGHSHGPTAGRHAPYGSAPVGGLGVVRRNAARWPAVAALLAAGPAAGAAAPLTSSAGRLFDAVSALLGLHDTVTYEGQAAMELERRADRTVRDGYPVSVTATAPAAGEDVLVIRGTDLVRGVVEDLGRGVQPAVIAARFHHGLAAAVVTAAARVAAGADLGTVALSGGVFGNMLLLGAVADGLARAGLRVLLHRRVPGNDGGVSLGQAAVAGALDARRGAVGRPPP
ncbi:carbamoyltransferase HypF [Microtetraspora sp. NBRC 13810]|uniref:carbamoyltransferase HypF n=1 Tax=Microtetraspora sp. NBRC 13810 TaxID=3030990 RepID=UPI0025569756|nr:carbamoyltransferase HypF [Microtetraspora sp. NBRC 13810]